MPPRFNKSILSALDIGSSKVCCFIAKIDDSGRARILGVGHQLSKGVKGGNVVNMEALQSAILNAVHSAEQMAGETIASTYVNVSCGQLQSQNLDVEMHLPGQEVRENDLNQLMLECRAHFERQSLSQTANDNALNRSLLHAIPVGYHLDGSRGIRDPRGMYGQRLGANIHLVTAQNAALRNLTSCIERCHLEIEGLAVTPLASGLACLVEDEQDLGATLIDMGGGTTSIAVFFDGHAVYTDVIPQGGQHVTNDIARGLSTSTAQAERLKTLYGCALAHHQGGDDLIKVPLIGEEEETEDNNSVPRSYLNRIIQPRIEEILESVRAKLETSGYYHLAGRRVVLTGGASQLASVRELAGLVLDRQIRLGKPIRLSGLAEAMSGPAFSTCSGLLQYAMQRQAQENKSHNSSTGKLGLISRAKQWLDEIL